MKSLGAAIGIAIAVCIALFAMFHAFGVGDKVAAPLASSALGLITFIHDKLEKALSAGKSPVSPGIVPVSEFDIRWPYMLVYITLTLIGIFELSNLLYLFPTMLLSSLGHTANTPANELATIGILATMALPIVAWAIYLVGRWTGIRSAKAGYWLLPLGILISRSLEIAALLMFFPVLRPGFALVTNPAVMAVVGTMAALLVGIGELGVWRGNRVRFGAYFNSLLRQVSEPTRATLLAMTYEEANAAHPEPLKQA
jgi:hypothetical protein